MEGITKGSGLWRKSSAYLLLCFFISVFCFQPVNAQNQTIGAGLEGQALIDYLQQNYTPTQTMGYNTARDTMYAVIDNDGGNLSGVYTGYTITLNPNEDPSTDAYNKGINAEHTWPQSMGAGNEPAKSDLHHLFPTKSNVNSARNNDPLGEIDDNLTDTWYYLDQSQSTIPTSNIDLYAENYGSTAFEPREQHKGNAARAVFYFVAIYQSEADQNFFDQQKDDLYQWHYADAVDAVELTRSSDIAGYQGNENPFVLDTSLVRRAFFPDGNTGNDTTAPVISSVQSSSIGSSSATITWTTDEAATSVVDYGTTTSYGSTESSSSSVTSHSITLTGLTANTSYNYQVSSTDASSNTGTSGNYTFTTTEEGSGTGTILFSEIFYDTPGTDSDEEWIELYNGTSSSIDLAGYTITDNNGTGSSYTFPSGSTVAAGSYFTVAANSSGFYALYGFDADQYGSISALNNSGDALILTDGLGTEVDAVAWEGGASAGLPSGWGSSSDPIASTGESIYRSSVSTDSDSYSDWAVATNNGDPQTQASVPSNADPVAQINGPYSGNTGSSISFSSAGSSDSDGTIASYQWDFGDGGSSNQANPSHTYSTANTYTVTLTVTDDDGATDQASTTATITDPVVNYILFSEIFYDTPGTDADEEWIELYNPTTSQITLAGFTIIDNNGTGSSYTFPSGTVIEAESYFTVASNQAGFTALYGNDAYQYGSIPALNNTGDALLLKDGSGSTVDEVAWEGGASAGVPSGWGTGPSASTGESLVRSQLDVDNDNDGDWTIALSNGDPATVTPQDVTAPVISSVSASAITETEATISWTTDENADSQVNYGETTSYGSSSGSGTYVTSHSVTLTGLTASTEYFYQVVSVDEAGNVAVDETYSFTTADPPSANLPDVMITEVFYDTPGNESKEEWVEIYNTTGQQINLNGWKLVDDNGNGQSFTFANKHKIDGNTFMTFALDRKDFKALYGKNADDFVNLPPLNNSGDVLVLKDGSGNTIDVVAWEGGANSLPSGWGSSSLPSAGEGNSIYRSDIGVDTDSYSDWATSTNLGSPMTQSDGTFFAKVAGSDNGVEEPDATELPDEISLGNYPNPFNPTTQIVYTLPETQRVKVAVYNMLGQQVALLKNGFAKAGSHTILFDASRLSSGVYVYTIRTETAMLSKKMLLIK
ncbi:MAG: PKD domain-containing protein [Balneolaceae bacterium]|nr:PKD domain-containing protein [Balneolaceae bacterium]